jgi:hypothetical protein
MNIISNMDEQRITHKAANQFMAIKK